MTHVYRVTNFAQINKYFVTKKNSKIRFFSYVAGKKINKLKIIGNISKYFPCKLGIEKKTITKSNIDIKLLDLT